MSDRIDITSNAENYRFVWVGPAESVAYDERGIRKRLLQLDQPCYVVHTDAGVGVAIGGMALPASSAQVPAGAVAGKVVASAPALTPAQLGDQLFKQTHAVGSTYATGSMANGIASEQLVTALGSANLLSSFGAAGLSLGRLEQAIWRIQQALPRGPYAFNLIYSPNDGDLEQQTVALYLKHGVTTIEASAYLKLTPSLVHYRVAGLKQDTQGKLVIANKVIAKASHEHVALQLLQPPPPALLSQLVRAGLITTTQANLAQYVPVADDLTVEADSGGHTDNQPLVCILPSMIALRDSIQARLRYPQPVRIGAAGGIGTPSAALAAYMMGAAYVVTGSINQASIEAGTSQHTKQLLAQATMTDTIMAPSADMFEQGVKVQLLKKGTLYPMQAQKLFDLYRQYDSIESMPAAERERIERQVFKKSIGMIWDEVIAYFQAHDPGQILRARDNPKHRMALIFRWYLGLSSHWASVAEQGRELDYQIWCGPAMGAFNDWVRGSYLEAPEQRSVVDMAHQIMRGAALLYRVQHLRLQGVQLPVALGHYRPMPLPTNDRGAIDEEDRVP